MLNKKIPLFYLRISLLFIAVINCVVVYFWLFQKSGEETPGERNMTEVLQSLTASGSGEVSPEIINSLTAPIK